MTNPVAVNDAGERSGAPGGERRSGDPGPPRLDLLPAIVLSPSPAAVAAVARPGQRRRASAAPATAAHGRGCPDPLRGVCRAPTRAARRGRDGVGAAGNPGAG